MSAYWNPVRVEFPAEPWARLGELVDSGSCVLVTSAGAVKRGWVDALRSRLGSRLRGVTTEVPSNPTVASVTAAAAALADSPSDLVLAIGGGSVLDTAKAVAALRTQGVEPAWLSRHLREKAPFPPGFTPPAIVAVPTTSGTGSEVTMWGTVWDEKTGTKYSISHPSLYPRNAVMSPALTASVPAEITAYTALDALSHAMEAIWNRAHNPVSDALAARAIAAIPSALRAALRTPRDLSARAELQSASLLAGMASSGTRTAIAHSISYPLTAELGLPHGFACSLTLPEILRLNGGADPERVALLCAALGARDVEDAVNVLYRLFRDIGLARFLTAYLPDEGKVRDVRGTFIAPGRAENNLVMVDQGRAKSLLMEAYSAIVRGAE